MNFKLELKDANPMSSTYCRTCLSSEMLFSPENKLVKIIRELLSIKISENPTEILLCLQCKETIINFHHYKLRCLEVDQYLNKTNVLSSDPNDSFSSLPLKDETEVDDSCYNDALTDAKYDIFPEGPEDNRLNENVEEECKKIETCEDSNKISTKKKLSCSECNETFHSRYKLQLHTKNAHANVINKRIKKSRLKTSPRRKINARRKNDGTPLTQKKAKRIVEYNHKLLTKGVIRKEKKFDELIDTFPCTECTEVFPTKIFLNRHFKVVHPDSKPSVKCSQCDLIFNYKDQLTRHVIKSHSKESERFKCSLCNKCARSKHALLNHIRLVHTNCEPIKCPKCEKFLKHEYSFKIHMRLHEVDVSERRIVCNICGVKVLNIVSHVNTVHAKKDDEKRFKCRFCESQTFEKLSELRQHQKVDHEKELKSQVYDVACEQCDKMFTSRANLYQHRISTHNNLRPYPCSLCGKKFKKRSGVREHMRYHTDDRPFPCTMCEKRFRSKSKLVNHVRIHTGEKPFACQVCEKTFAQKSNVKIHMSVHNKAPQLNVDAFINTV